MSSKKANRVLVLVLLLIVLPAISIGMHRRLISLFNRLLSLFSIIFLFFIKLYELRKDQKKNKRKNLSKYNQHVLLEVCNMFFRHAKANDLIH
jgi:predicted aspartyl protease